AAATCTASSPTGSDTMDERRGSVVEGPSPPAVCGTAEPERRAGPDRLAPFDQGPERLPRAVRAPAERVAQLVGPGTDHRVQESAGRPQAGFRRVGRPSHLERPG